MSGIDSPQVPSAVLSTLDLCAGYRRVPVVHDLNIEIAGGDVVALLGANGAGKSTTLKTIAGWLPPISGSIVVDGQAVKDSIHKRARRGVAYISEERAVFYTLSTLENLRLVKNGVEVGLEYMPELKPLLKRRAALLSGGEQQFLAIARALATKPRLLMIDELSLGLAPKIVDRLLVAIRRTADSGVGVLIVEQYAQRALDVADRVYVMRRGRVVASGTSSEVRGSISEIEGMYLSSKTITDGPR